MKVLVTGGAGFIGSHIVDLLVSKGIQVVVIDDLSTGNLDNVNKQAKFYRLDIISPEIEQVFENEKPDAVIHEAAKVNLRESIKNPELYERVNVLGTINILECCRKFGVKKFIYAASAARYGVPEYLPCDENHPIDLISPYAISKYIAEKYIEFYQQVYGINYVILIYSNAYGPRQNYSNETGVISIFINKLLKNEIPDIFGDGQQTRDFVYVEDVAHANFLALTDIRAENRKFNVCFGQEVSVNFLFTEISGILASNIKAVHKPKIKGEVERFFPDNTLIFDILNWKPEVDINSGLKKTIEYYKNHLSNSAK